MAVEDDAVEVEDLALLKLGAAPDGGERGQMDAARCGPWCAGGGSPGRASSPSRRGGRRLRGSRGLWSLRLFDFFFFAVGAVDNLLDFDFFGDSLGRGQSTAGHVGAEVEAEAGCVAQEAATAKRVRSRSAANAARRGWGWDDDSTHAAGDVGFDLGLNLFQVHRRSSLDPLSGLSGREIGPGGLPHVGVLGGSRSCAPKPGTELAGLGGVEVPWAVSPVSAARRSSPAAS
jgi:hypothetical protein